MSVTRKILTTAAIAGAGAAAVALKERRMIAELDSTPSPTGWKMPVFPAGHELMVPISDGAELVVGVAGPPDGPTVVLVHGLSGRHHDWGPVAERLVANGCQVLAINQRGHGGSTVGTEGFGAARQGADVGEVLSAIDVDNVTLVGHSMGGMAAMSMLALRPDTGKSRVHSLVIIASLAQGTGFQRQLTIRLGESKLYELISEHPVHSVTFTRMAFGKGASREQVEHVLASSALCPPEHARAAAAGIGQYDIRDKLGEIDVPALVICGTRDLLTLHNENQAIADALPIAEFHSVPEAGHMIIWEHPELLAQCILDRTVQPSASTSN